MSRFIADYQSGKPDDFIKFVSEVFFAKEGFRPVNYKGETVWKKGVGFLTAPSFISFRYSQGNIHLEAWIKSFGEHGLDGFYGAVPKKALKNRVDALMSLLSQDVPVPEGGAAPQPDAAAAPAAPVPVEVHNPTGKATVALVTGHPRRAARLLHPADRRHPLGRRRLERRGRAQEHEQRPRDGGLCPRHHRRRGLHPDVAAEHRPHRPLI